MNGFCTFAYCKVSRNWMKMWRKRSSEKTEVNFAFLLCLHTKLCNLKWHYSSDSHMVTMHGLHQALSRDLFCPLFNWSEAQTGMKWWRIIINNNEAIITAIQIGTTTIPPRLTTHAEGRGGFDVMDAGQTTKSTK